MKTMKSAVVLLLLLTIACGEEAKSPIEPAGEIPPLLGALPDDAYLAVGLLDVAAFVQSDFGLFVTSRFATHLLLARLAGVDLQKDIQAAAIGLKFDTRAWPNVARSFQAVLALKTTLTPEIFGRLLKLAPFEQSDHGGTPIYRFELNASASSVAMPLFVSFPGDGLLLFSTSGELAERAVDAARGAAPGITAASGIAPLLARADKTGVGWLVMRTTTESRNLLQMLPACEDAIGLLQAGKDLNGVWVMTFSDAELARRTVKQHEISSSQMQEFVSRFTRPEEMDLQMRASLEAMRLITAEQRGSLAIYSFTLTPAWLTRLMQEPAASAPPTDTTEAGK